MKCFKPEYYNSSKVHATDLQLNPFLFSYVLPFVLEGLLYGGEPPHILYITNHDTFPRRYFEFSAYQCPSKDLYQLRKEIYLQF